MFRENVLTNDEIIDRIARTMVPVAVDRWKAEDPRTAEAHFLQPFLKRHPPQGSPCIYAPDGKVLGGFRGFDRMAARTKTMINDALAAFGPVTPREVKPAETHPYRGKRTMPDGSVRLAEYVRPSAAALAHMNTETPVISSVTLTREKFARFAPRQAAVGARWTLPDAVARKLSRITSPMCYQHAPQPDWVTSVRIRAEVRSIANGVAQVRYHGRIASEHRVAGQLISVQEADLTGKGLVNLQDHSIRSLQLIGTGRLTWPEAPEKLVTFDSLVEWTAL